MKRTIAAAFLASVAFGAQAAELPKCPQANTDLVSAYREDSIMKLLDGTKAAERPKAEPALRAYIARLPMPSIDAQADGIRNAVKAGKLNDFCRM